MANIYIFNTTTGRFDHQPSLSLSATDYDFVIDGIKYNSVIQYMLHNKALIMGDYDIARRIKAETRPHAMKQHEEKIKNVDRAKWESVMYDLTLKGMSARIEQNPRLSDIVAESHNEIVQASMNEYYWGTGRNNHYFESYIWSPQHMYSYTGLNVIGNMLNKIRLERIAATKFPVTSFI